MSRSAMSNSNVQRRLATRKNAGGGGKGKSALRYNAKPVRAQERSAKLKAKLAAKARVSAGRASRSSSGSAAALATTTTRRTSNAKGSSTMKKKATMKKLSMKKAAETQAKLKFQTTKMRDHLEAAKAKLRAKFGNSLKGVNYKKAAPVIGATTAARLTARGVLERADGSKTKGVLGKR